MQSGTHINSHVHVNGSLYMGDFQKNEDFSFSENNLNKEHHNLSLHCNIPGDHQLYGPPCFSVKIATGAC